MTTLLSGDTIDQAAQIAADLSRKLSDVDADLYRRSHHLVWQGSAADRYYHANGPIHTGLRRRAADLEEVGRLLGKAAELLRQQRSAIGAAQARVEAVLRGQTNQAAYLRSVGWTQPGLPPAYDPAWERLAQLVAAKAKQPQHPSGGAGL